MRRTALQKGGYTPSRRRGTPGRNAHRWPVPIEIGVTHYNYYRAASGQAGDGYRARIDRVQVHDCRRDAGNDGRFAFAAVLDFAKDIACKAQESAGEVVGSN
jgi:hypothetical protein